MKNKTAILAIAFLVVFTVNAQEKKIKFSKGTLKICSSKTFKIEGYNGSEVIIKSLHDKKNSFPIVTGIRNNSSKAIVKGKFVETNKKNLTYAKAKNVHTSGNFVFFSANETKRKKGLKRLGKKQENKDLGIYFTIEQKDGELIFKDATNGQFVMLSNESYLIKIPNSIKLKWDTSNCKKGNRNQNFFYSNKTSSLSNFNGEVELTTSLSNFKLTDVTGPVSINSIGGNVTVEFDKKLPLKLYSIYTNNGFIDITMPQNSDVNVEANASAVYSDINFNVLQDTESDGQQHMKLKLRRGKVKMKLEAGFGRVYLRKK
jgi:hypothetical protein